MLGDKVGKKIANGAFGELRLGMDIENRKVSS